MGGPSEPKSDKIAVLSEGDGEKRNEKCTKCEEELRNSPLMNRNRADTDRNRNEKQDAVRSPRL